MSQKLEGAVSLYLGQIFILQIRDRQLLFLTVANAEFKPFRVSNPGLVVAHFNFVCTPLRVSCFPAPDKLWRCQLIICLSSSVHCSICYRHENRSTQTLLSFKRKNLRKNLEVMRFKSSYLSFYFPRIFMSVLSFAAGLSAISNIF